MHVGSGKESKYCVPFVSEYTDCNEDNLCSGCSKCTCTAEGKWNCKNIQECPDEDDDYKSLDENDIDKALMILEKELKNKEMNDRAASDFPLAPGPDKSEDLLLEEKEVNMEDEILALMRSKRSVDETVQEGHKENIPVKFFNAVDEINEDTLKVLNVSGTMPAQKVNTLPQTIKKPTMLNSSTSNSLQIEYNSQPKENNHHDDNKVDTPTIHDDKEDLLVHSNIYNVMANYSQHSKDKELSKLLVNELKRGDLETIGDKKAPVISNITFTPENDTLTAMAFIAGNLLNKLWNMEKDTSDDHIDAEVLKHEEIADLLELFKEPLSIRQELFLKNALEQLSSAINQHKDVDNIALCKHLEVKKLLTDIDNKENMAISNSDCNNVKQAKENKDTLSAKALNKINNVLDLIKKYENVQSSLSDMKSEKSINSLRSNNRNLEKTLTKDEKSSFDLYGKTLETITKLLIPNKNNKKMANLIQNRNVFKTDKDLKSKLSDIKLDNLNITTKDKIVLDYLAHIQSNPECLLKRQRDKITLPSLEGNILLNLSEFFKIKSLSDLVKLIEPSEHITSALRLQATTTQKPVKEQTSMTESIEKDNPKKFRDTKERLKGHLKSIIEDLMELQKVESHDTKSKDIRIIEALPCIYNLLNTGNKEIAKPTTASEKNTISTTSYKIREIFSNLKKELKLAQSRRTNTLNGPRPKSAVVWERVIKNAEGKLGLQTRRHYWGKTHKTIEELKVFMDKIESGSNTYKNYAYLNEVPPAERLLLLKTFNADTVRYVKALQKIATLLSTKPSLSKESIKEFSEFIDNVEVNVNLNEKVIKNLSKPKKNNKFTYLSNPRSQIKNKAELKLNQQHTQTIELEPKSYDTKLTRDQIINQLIKNRLLLYIQTKDGTRETHNDMNYNIAKKILFHLEVGNFQLARELYKVLASHKQDNSGNVEKNNVGLTRKQMRIPTRKKSIELEPLIEFEDSTTINKEVPMVNQDHFIKHLLNLRDIKF